MARISIKVGLEALSDSNAFLRALWAELRREFGSLSWAHAPHRDGAKKTISFGEVQLGGNDILSVVVSYKTKGSIQEITFSDELSRSLRNAPSEQSIFKRISDSTRVALERFRHPSEFIMNSILRINSSKTFHYYKGNSCALRPMGLGKVVLQLRVAAFDSIDARNEYHVRATGICDQLTAWTNISVTMAWRDETDDAIDPAQTEEKSLQPNTHWAEPDWIDGAPVVENRIAITQDQFSWVDAYAGRVVDHRHPIASATRHFAEALRLRNAGQFPEISETLLVSALEAIGEKSFEPKNCPSCDQPIHKISKRVYELADRHLGGFVAGRIKRFYEERSKFLHAGAISAHYPATFGSLPQLDPKNQTGCVLVRNAAANLNLVEFVGFILRAECANWSSNSHLEHEL